MKSFSSKRAGFTLVEIMIVVAIIGLLATMAIPNFVKSRQKAAQTACISNLRLIDGAVQEWALDMKKDSGQAVSYADIKGYLRNSVSCPSGGTTFDDSYTVSTVDVQPTCQRQPTTHQLPQQ